MSLPEIGTWTEGPGLPVPQSWFGCAAVDKKVYFIGGSQGSQNEMQIYDTVNETWSTGAPLPHKFYYSACTAVGHKIYYIGGITGSGWSNRLDIYNIETNTWSAGANVPDYFVQGTAVEHDNKLYCFGEGRSTIQTTPMYIYDIATNTWSTKATLQIQLSRCSGTVHDGKIYAAGNISNKQLVVYDIATDTWSLGPQKKYNYSITTCTQRGEYIYFFGWYGIEIYHIESNTWSVSKPLAVYYADTGAIVEDSFYGAYLDNPLQIYTFGEKPAVIHRYQTGSGGTSDFMQYEAFPMEPGCDYTTSVPHISGYQFKYYYIDASNESIRDPNILPEIKNIQVDHTIFFVYGVDETPVTTHTVTEQFHSVDGTPLKEEAEKLIPEGEAYVATAPAISGWRYTGWQLDGGPVQNGTASIPAVDGDHTITFLYEEDGGEGDGYTVTESYLNLLDGSFLQADTFTQVPAGGSYNKTAPEISGYKRVGHRIDGGTNSPELTASIPLVSGDHQIFFLYVKDENEGGGNNGDDCKCCCGSLKLELNLPICNNREMLQELKELVQAAKSCDNSTC